MRTILQVEDDPNDVFFLQHAMKKAGGDIFIHVATDGQMAIDYLNGSGKFADREQYPMPCLILLDLKLPHVMGLDVLKWIRQQADLAVAVVLLTASGETTEIAAAYRLGANGFLIKPSEAAKFEAMVKAINDFWLTHNTLPAESYSEPLGAGAAAPARDRFRRDASAAVDGGERRTALTVKPNRVPVVFETPVPLVEGQRRASP